MERVGAYSVAKGGSTWAPPDNSARIQAKCVKIASPKCLSIELRLNWVKPIIRYSLAQAH